MTEEEATRDYEELTYKLAKAVSQLSYIRERMDYINNEMGWDGLFMCDFESALRLLANVESAAITYSLENKYRDKDVQNLKRELESLTCSHV